jgi:hypothetical protein
MRFGFPCGVPDDSDDGYLGVRGVDEVKDVREGIGERSPSDFVCL